MRIITPLLCLVGLSISEFATAAAPLLVTAPTQANLSNTTISSLNQGVVSCKDSQDNTYYASSVSIGTQRKVRVVKLGSGLQQLWQTDFSASVSLKSNVPFKMVCKNGKVFITGVFSEGLIGYSNPIVGEEQDVFLATLNASNGALAPIVIHKFPVPGLNLNSAFWMDSAYLLEVDSQNNAYLIGTAGVTINQGYLYGHSKWAVTKINSQGVVLWSQFHAGPYLDPDPYYARNSVKNSALSSDESKLFISGYIAKGSDITGASVIKLDTNTGAFIGQPADLETVQYQGSKRMTLARGLAVDANDNVYIGSTGGDYSAQTAATFITKLNSSLSVQWIYSLNSPNPLSEGEFQFIDFDSQGNIISSGYITQSRLVTVKLDPSSGSQIFKTETTNPSGGILRLTSQFIDGNNIKLVYYGKINNITKSDVFATQIQSNGMRFGTVTYNNQKIMLQNHAYPSMMANNGDIILLSNSSVYTGFTKGVDISRIKITQPINSAFSFH